MRQQDLTLYDIGLIDAGPDIEFDSIADLVAELTDAPVALVCIVEPERNRQYFKAARGLGEPWLTRRETPLTHSFCQHVRATGHPLVVRNSRIHPLVKDNGAVEDLNVIAYLGVPIHGIEGERVGALCAIDGKPREWSEADVSKLETLARFADAQIQLRALLKRRNAQLTALTREIDLRTRAEQELKKLATTDPLTGTKNRRAFLERVEDEVALIERHKREAALVMFDLDHFKSVNDQHGHNAGDEVLKEACERINAAIRNRIDFLARLGGEEFVLLLPNTSKQTAMEIAERCREAISAIPFNLDNGEKVAITSSFGVAQLTAQLRSGELALVHADQALYTAKSLGRNTVVHFTEVDDTFVAAE